MIVRLYDELGGYIDTHVFRGSDKEAILNMYTELKKTNKTRITFIEVDTEHLKAKTLHYIFCINKQRFVSYVRPRIFFFVTLHGKVMTAVEESDNLLEAITLCINRSFQFGDEARCVITCQNDIVEAPARNIETIAHVKMKTLLKQALEDQLWL